MLAPLFFLRLQQQVHSGTGRGREARATPAGPDLWESPRGRHGWPLHKPGIHPRPGAKREDLIQLPSPTGVRGRWPGLSPWACALGSGEPKDQARLRKGHEQIWGGELPRMLRVSMSRTKPYVLLRLGVGRMGNLRAFHH